MALEIVNRERELQQLRDLAAAPPALVVLYGRRRVGKSFLLRVGLTGDRVISYQAERQALPQQLAGFAAEAASLLPGAPPLAFGSWGDALSFVEAQARASGPLTVVLDEFQYLAASEAALESTIQTFWDRWEHEQVPVLLVLSGSALSFMEGLFGGSKAMFGRSSYRPLLLPLTYRHAVEFAPAGLSEIEQLERFAVLGGTPQYQRWAGQRALRDVVQDVILPVDAPLYSDPAHLIREEPEIRDPANYFGALEAIATGSTTPVQIAGELGVKAQAVDYVLDRLGKLGYVQQVEPLEPGSAGKSRAYWKILDPYFRFWFRYVFPNRSRLARGRIRDVLKEIERDLPTFTGPIFEDCCRFWLGHHSALGADATEIGSWWSRKSDVEVDVVASSKKGYSVLGSCKWWAKPVGENVLDELIEARAAIGPKAARARLVIFAKTDFTEALRERAGGENVLLLTAADLYDKRSDSIS